MNKQELFQFELKDNMQLPLWPTVSFVNLDDFARTTSVKQISCVCKFLCLW